MYMVVPKHIYYHSKQSKQMTLIMKHTYHKLRGDNGVEATIDESLTCES